MIIFLPINLAKWLLIQCTGFEVIKDFFMLNSAEHEILNASKYENIKNISISQAQIGLECYFSCSAELSMIFFIKLWDQISNKTFPIL